jgi:hypothetical protein
VVKGFAAAADKRPGGEALFGRPSNGDVTRGNETPQSICQCPVKVPCFRGSTTRDAECCIVGNQTLRSWRSAAQVFFGSIALASVTLACFRLEIGLATTAFIYLVVIVLLSLMGSFLSPRFSPSGRLQA